MYESRGSEREVAARGSGAARFCAWLVCLVAWLAASAGAATVWTWDTGEVDLDALPRNTHELRLRHAQAMIIAGQCRSAIKDLKDLIKEEPGEEIEENARFEIAHALHLNGNYEEGFDEFSEFLDKYRGSRREVDAVQEQFQICQDAARDSPGKGVELFEKMLLTPYVGDLADDCQKGIGDCYFNMGDHEGAWDAYNILIENYDQSIWISYCLYRIPYARYLAGKRLENEKTLMAKARDGFQNYLDRYPTGAYAEQALEYLVELNMWLARRDLFIAQFYFKKKQVMGSLTYSRLVIKSVPGTPEANEAWQMINHLLHHGFLRPDQVEIETDAAKSSEP